MRVLKVRAFARWARREKLADSALSAAVEEMRRGLVDAKLGGGLVKKRVARRGGGKSGGYRTLLAADLRGRWIFLYGFGKSERDDIDDDELRALKRLAHVYLTMSEEMIDELLVTGKLARVEHDESETS